MANNRQRRYRTYGNIAYQPNYDGSAVRAPKRREQYPQPERKPQVKPRRRVLRRPKIQVREAGAFAPFAVIGFAAVAILAAFLLVENARLMIVNDQMVALRSDLKVLQEEQATLIAQYELTYDLNEIESQLTADGSMVKPQPSQMTYLDVSGPDSMVLFEGRETGLAGLAAQVKRFFSGLLS